MKSTDYLKSKKIEFKLIHLPEVPKNANDVERLYGCPLKQVLKTLLFIGEKEPVLVVVHGDKRVDLVKLKKITGQNLRIAKPDEVTTVTGYSIGGVTPFGIEKDIKKIIDKSVFDEPTINIGSGKAEIEIEIKSVDLKAVWDGEIGDIIN